jgi:DNA repair photolyase
LLFDAMKIGTCSPRKILQPCELSGYRYQIDPYIGCEHHCYYCYALNQAETDWTQQILVYPDFVAQLAVELSSLKPQPIYFGWNSDPYQPAEVIHQHTRRALELLAERDFSVCILTKSDLVTRDIELIAQMPGSSVGFSIAFRGEDERRLFEVKAPPNRRRIAGLKMLKDAGIQTYALICPIMPHITDVEACVEMVAPYADTIWFYALSIESGEDPNWRNVRGILDLHYPSLTESYRRSAFLSDHPYWTQLRSELKALQSKTNLNMKIKL